MRPPTARFPFIISFQQKNRGGETGDTALLSFLQYLGKELKILSRGNEDNFSLVLKKILFLESTLDELLEAKTSEKDERVHSLLEREKQKMEKFFPGMIPILDNLDATCRSAAGSEEPELARGLEMLNRKLVRHLSSWGFTKSADEGMKFDPLFHEAVGTNLSSLEPGLITDIIEHGWILNGKVLRFAKVIVAK